MIRYYFRQLGKSERGATLIEFAIIALLLFTLLFGIIEFGWILFSYISLTAAVREGVRLAVVSEYTDVSDEDIKNIIQAHTRSIAINKADIFITPEGERMYSMETEVEVRNAELQLLTGLFGSSIQIATPDRVIRASMMHE